MNLDADIPDIHHQLPPLPATLPKRHERFIHCIPPTGSTTRKYSVFLAGTIEMGKAIQWQRHMLHFLQDLPIAVYNPRRGSWNKASTDEELTRNFHTQVVWEKVNLARASVICFFFDHPTKSPVTMMELGEWAASNKVVVCCNSKFWKAKNVHIQCAYHGIPCVETFEELVPLVRAKLRSKGLMLDKQGDRTDDPAKEDPTKLPDVSILERRCPVDIERLKAIEQTLAFQDPEYPDEEPYVEH